MQLNHSTACELGTLIAAVRRDDIIEIIVGIIKHSAETAETRDRAIAIHGGEREVVLGGRRQYIDGAYATDLAIARAITEHLLARQEYHWGRIRRPGEDLANIAKTMFEKIKTAISEAAAEAVMP